MARSVESVTCIAMSGRVSLSRARYLDHVKSEKIDSHVLAGTSDAIAPFLPPDRFIYASPFP